MADRNDPSDEQHIDPDVTSDVGVWATPEEPASPFFAPPASTLDLGEPTPTLAEPTLAEPTLPPPPPPPHRSAPPRTLAAPPTLPPPPSADALASSSSVPASPATWPLAAPSAGAGWFDDAPNAEVRDFPASAKAATPYRPDRSEPGAVIDLSDHAEHPYSELYDLTDGSADDSAEDLVVAPSRALPDDLQQALLGATAASTATPDTASLPAAPFSPLGLSAPLPVIGTEAIDQAPASLSMISIDTLGEVPLNISGLFTDVLTDNGFKATEVNQSSTALARNGTTVTVEMLDESDGAIVQVDGQDPTPIQRLLVAGFIEAGFTVRSSVDDATVLGHDKDCLVRLTMVPVDRS